MNSILTRMEGIDYFHYECSECDQKLVTLIKYTYPVQCSHICVEKHVKRITETYENFKQKEALGVEMHEVQLKITTDV